jgi:hypothetical protein
LLKKTTVGKKRYNTVTTQVNRGKIYESNIFDLNFGEKEPKEIIT